MSECHFKFWPTNSTCMCGHCALRRTTDASSQRSARGRIFGKLTATATREAAAQFMATWYRRTYGRGRRRLVAVCRVTVPANYKTTLVGLRRRLGISQLQLAARVGAASKAVVYQWESGKRKPSPVFWLRIERLQRELPISFRDGISMNRQSRGCLPR